MKIVHGCILHVMQGYRFLGETTSGSVDLFPQFDSFEENIHVH